MKYLLLIAFIILCFISSRYFYMDVAGFDILLPVRTLMTNTSSVNKYSPAPVNNSGVGEENNTVTEREQPDKKQDDELSELSKLAKSKTTFEYLMHTRKQNNYADQTNASLAVLNKMNDDFKNVDQNDRGKVVQKLKPYCAEYKKYINSFKGIVYELKQRLDLANNHQEISSELYNVNKQVLVNTIQKMYNEQAQMLNGEIKSYSDMNCDFYLNNKINSQSNPDQGNKLVK